MTDISHIRDLIISLSRSWHPSREQVQRIVDAAQGVEIVMQAPDASAVAEEAVEAALEAWSNWIGTLECALPKARMKSALLAALPHLRAEKDAEIAALGQSNQTLTAEIARLKDVQRNSALETKAEIERLREALGQISRMSPMPDHKANTMTLVAAGRIARAALGDAT